MSEQGSSAPVDMRDDRSAMAEGHTAAPSSANETFERQYRQFSAAASLQELSEEYVYFTHGLLFTHGFWRTDPIVDHIVETGGECAPFAVQMPMPVFRWFEGKDVGGEVVDGRWNKQICVVAKEHWPALYRFLCLIEGINRDSKTVIKPVPQVIPIVDAFALARMSSLPERIPTVNCYCLALLTNRRTVYFAPESRRFAFEPIPILTRNPDPKTVRYAKALLHNQASPMAGTLEPTLSEAEAVISGMAGNKEKILEAIRNPTPLHMTDREAIAHVGLGDDPRTIRLLSCLAVADPVADLTHGRTKHDERSTGEHRG